MTPPESYQQKRRLSNIGSLCKVIETPQNLCIQSGFMVVDNSAKGESSWRSKEGRQRMVETLFWERVISKHDRFRYLVSDDGNYFVRDPDFNMANHIALVDLNTEWREQDETVTPEDLEERAFRDLVSRQMSLPFDSSHPMWNVVAVQNYSRGIVLFWRCHHCYGDGSSTGAIIFGNLCDQKLDNPEDYGFTTSANNVTTTTPNNNININNNNNENKNNSNKNGGNMVSLSLRVLDAVPKIPGFGEKGPLRRTLQVFVTMLFLVIGLIRMTVYILMDMLHAEPDTIFRNERISRSKSLAWGYRMSISECKEIARNLGIRVTVNDVALCCISGAMQRYREEMAQRFPHMYDSDPVNVRLAVPVNVRKEPIIREMGNIFGYMTSTLPLSSHLGPLDRLRVVKSRMDYAKSLPMPLVSFAITNSSILTHFVANHLFGVMSSSLTLCCSNVRAPQRPLSIWGHRVTDFSGFMPLPNKVAFGCLVMSYNDTISISITADRSTIPDPERLVQYCQEEFSNVLNMSRRDIQSSVTPAPASQIRKRQEHERIISAA